MANTGPKNTILSDPTPYLPPEQKQQATKKPKPSDWAKLGKSRKYKEIDRFLEQRKEYFKHFLPGGKALAELAIEDPAKAGMWAAVASTIVDEIEAIQFKIAAETGK